MTSISLVWVMLLCLPVQCSFFLIQVLIFWISFGEPSLLPLSVLVICIRTDHIPPGESMTPTLAKWEHGISLATIIIPGLGIWPNYSQCVSGFMQMVWEERSPLSLFHQTWNWMDVSQKLLATIFHHKDEVFLKIKPTQQKAGLRDGNQVPAM